MNINSICCHARIRCQQRGIKLSLLDLIVDEADLITHTGGGVRAFQISRRRIRALGEKGVAPKVLEQVEGIAVLVADGQVVTAFHARGTDARPYRRQYKNGHRRRRDVH